MPGPRQLRKEQGELDEVWGTQLSGVGSSLLPHSASWQGRQGRDLLRVWVLDHTNHSLSGYMSERRDTSGGDFAFPGRLHVAVPKHIAGRNADTRGRDQERRVDADSCANNSQVIFLSAIHVNARCPSSHLRKWPSPTKVTETIVREEGLQRGQKGPGIQGWFACQYQYHHEDCG